MLIFIRFARMHVQNIEVEVSHCETLAGGGSRTQQRRPANADIYYISAELQRALFWAAGQGQIKTEDATHNHRGHARNCCYLQGFGRFFE